MVGIVSPDGLAWAGAGGLADLEHNVPAQVGTLYQVGSLTKVFTATLIMWLRDHGRLTLDDPVNRYLPSGTRVPEADPRGEQVMTLRHLLYHASGLPGNPPNRRDVDGVMQPYGRADLWSGISATALRYPVGRTWSYSNFGYAILGAVAERAGRAPYEALLQRHLLAPLGMTDTRIALSDSDEVRLAVHYWPEDEPRIARPRWVFGDVAAFGGIASTVPDLARFMAWMLGGDPEPGPLAQGTRAEMLRPQFLRPGGVDAMGIGWWITRDPALGLMVHHGGEVDGHSSELILFPSHQLGLVVLANLGGSTAADLGALISQELVTAARAHDVPTRDQAFAWYFERDWPEASWALDLVTRARQDDGVAWFRLGNALFQQDRFAESARAWERAATLSFFPRQAMVQRARIAAIREQPDSAFRWLQAACAPPEPCQASVATLPEFGHLQADPRWKDLFRTAPE